MRVLILSHAFNSLTQRLWAELARDGHDLTLELDVNDRVTEEAVALARPELIVAPFLKRAIPSRCGGGSVASSCTPVSRGTAAPRRSTGPCNRASGNGA